MPALSGLVIYCVNMRIFVALLLFALLLVVGISPLLAQQTTATLLGAISDPSGASVPGVTVRVVNLATGLSRETTTDQAGNYSIPFLTSGDYRVTAAKEGFQAQRIDTVTLQVDQSARVDFTLTIGNVAESINVTASSALLQTENATVGTVIDGSK